MKPNPWKDIRDGCEHTLVNTKDQCGDTGGTHGWLAIDTPESEVLEVTDVSIGTVAESERVTPEEPLKLKPHQRETG
jgi:hypothetical protein